MLQPIVLLVVNPALSLTQIKTKSIEVINLELKTDEQKLNWKTDRVRDRRLRGEVVLMRLYKAVRTAAIKVTQNCNERNDFSFIISALLQLCGKLKRQASN